MMWREPAQPTALTLVALTVGFVLYLRSAPAHEENARHPLNCGSLTDVTDLEPIAYGWTKSVFRGRLRGRRIAVKTVNLNGHDIQDCLSRPEVSGFSRCYRRTSAKLLRELIILEKLEHPNVVKVLGSCIPDSFGPVVIATELGEPLEYIALLQLSWEEKLKLVLSVASLLHLLAHSPLGSLAVPNLKRQQFVLVDGQLKLADADDLATSEPSCFADEDCIISDSDGVYCISGVCRGYNERSNIIRAGQDLVKHILLDTGPEILKPQVKDLLAAFTGRTRWDSLRILRETQALVEHSG